MVNSRKPSSKVKTLLDSTVDPESAIKDLQRQKVESKLYHIRTKVLPKQMKKVKVSLTQRVVKKMKQPKLDQEKGILDAELSRFKLMDHLRLATWAYNTQLIKNDEYLKGKFGELGIEFAETETFEDSEKLISSKCFQDAMKESRAEVNSFIRKLFHEVQFIPKVKREEISVKELPKAKERPKERKLLKADKSFFMDSLNAEDSDLESSGQIDVEGERHHFDRSVAFSDDEEGDESDGYVSDSEEHQQQKPKKKKNRLGQMARRRLAEKAYGREAKHIQSGGLTVQQKEELRKQKSQQKKDRSARIKKEIGKIKPRGSTETIKSFTGKDVDGKESVKLAPTIKIDPNMHPSWAAKLQQQAKLQSASYQGQKIKFDE